MSKFRTKSARFSIRRNTRKNTEFLWLDYPYPKVGDIEWGLRISIDKYFILVDNPRVDDGGAASSGLCIANKNLSNRDNLCGGCPIKDKTGEPNCDATPFPEYFATTTYEQRKVVYQKMFNFLMDLYAEKFGIYIPGYYDEEMNETYEETGQG